MFARASAVVLATISLSTLIPAAQPSTAAQLPIDHVLVLMQENRSFDSYSDDSTSRDSHGPFRSPAAPVIPIPLIRMGARSEPFTRPTTAR